MADVEISPATGEDFSSQIFDRFTEEMFGIVDLFLVIIWVFIALMAYKIFLRKRKQNKLQYEEFPKLTISVISSNLQRKPDETMLPLFYDAEDESNLGIPVKFTRSDESEESQIRANIINSTGDSGLPK